MSYMQEYEKWLASPALSEQEHAELESIRDDEKEIRERFYGPLEFGTAGLRGTMKVGLHQMNIHVIRHATQAFAEVILAEGPEAVKRGIKAGDLVKSVCAICGGKGGGIGYGLSTAFAKEGCNLVITGRNTKKLDDAKEELERLYGVKVLACQADGGVEEQVAAVVKQAADTLGRIDFLINNAQNSASGVPLAEHTKEQFDQAIYSGLYAAFFYMKHCYPYLKETKGSAGLFGKPGQSSYAAAKEGIRGMTRVAATEWGPDGINCNLICPLVMTDALKKWREEYPAVYEQTIKGIPAGRFGDPEKDIGRTAVFLCSEDAKYISGETITMQGGSGLRP